MNRRDTPATNSRFPARSILALLLFTGLLLIAFQLYQQNQNLQRTIETLTSRVEHLEASGEHAEAKFEKLVTYVSDEPVLRVP